ncbi:MAG: alpha/beta fold hydrolase [Elusimicrobia bacterium]|nr:alpha/beta fold hydrolase [Elusimicrobiota bacterium]
MSGALFGGITIVGLAALGRWLWSLSYIILRPPITPSVNLPEMFGLSVEEVEFESEDGALLRGWWIASPKGDSDRTIVCCHGWGTNSGDVLPQTWYLNQEGFNLFYFDFRGCGRSPRRGLSSLGFYETRDLIGALKFIRRTYPRQCSRIGIYGLSMGAVTALAASATDQGSNIGAVAAEAPFFSFRWVVSRYMQFHYSIGWFPWDFIYTETLIWRLGRINQETASPIVTAARFKPPRLLLICGDRDYMAWPSDSKEIARLADGHDPARVDLWIVPGADHAECFLTQPAQYRSRLSSFFKQALPG